MLIYNRVQKKNPMDPEGPKKWFPVLKRRVLMQEHEVAQEISEETTLNPMEARMALYQLQKVMVKALLDGKTVQLGELGTFQLTLHAEGANDKESADHTMVKKINLRFRAAPKLKESLAKANLSTAASLYTEQP